MQSTRLAEQFKKPDNVQAFLHLTLTAAGSAIHAFKLRAIDWAFHSR